MVDVTAKVRPFNKLPKRKQEFVKQYLRLGEGPEAFKAAGYSWTERNLKARARKLLIEMQPYLPEQIMKYATSNEMAILSVNVQAELAKDKKINPQVRLNAAKEIQARCFPEQPKEVEHRHIHEHKQLTNTELDDEIRALGLRLLEAKPVEVEVVNDGVQVERTSNEGQANAEEQRPQGPQRAVVKEENPTVLRLAQV